jgi:phosphoglycerate dehydrogenase-like enzyme
MKKVAIGFSIPKEKLEELGKELGELYEFHTFDPRHHDPGLLRSAEVLVLLSSNARVISEASSCRWVHSWSVGVDEYLSLDRFKGNNATILTNSGASYGPQISEHVFAMIFAFTRDIKAISLNQGRKRWVSRPPSGDKGELSEMTGRIMGIIGVGHVGLEIAKRAKSFGLRVIGVRRHVSAQFRIQELGAYVDEVYPLQELAAVLAKSDIIVNTLPLTSETKGLFDRARFQDFKGGAMFVNVGRGGTVVERDLVEALRGGVVRYAALDVFEEEPLPGNSPLWGMENVLVSPHCAGRSDKLDARAFSILKENLERYSKNAPLRNQVDTKAGY